MIRYCQYIVCIWVNIITIRPVSTQYIYHELDEHIIRTLPFNFTLFIKNATGIILYAIDSNNKILIEIEDDQGEKILIVKYNKYRINEKLATLCGCYKCTDITMGFYLDLKTSKFQIRCQEISHTVSLPNQKIEDKFAGYPIPKDYYDDKRKTYIWMGNIGPYMGYGDVVHHPIKNKLLGCLETLYVNNKLINVTSNGTYFYVCCQRQLHKTECVNGKSPVKFKSPVNFDWKIIDEKRKYCISDSLNYESLGKSFVIDNNNNQSVAMVLEYKLRYHNKSSNYGLMEIQLQDESLVLFHLSGDDDTIMSTKRNGSYDVKYRQKIFPHLNNILLIGFIHQNVFIKLSSIDGIKCYQYKLTAEIIVANVGFFQQGNTIANFEGSIGFSCSWSQCQLPRESIIPNQIVKRPYLKLYLIIAVVAVSLFSMILFLILVINNKTSRSHLKKESSDKAGSSDNNVIDDTDAYSVYRQSMTNSVYMIVADAQ